MRSINSTGMTGEERHQHVGAWLRPWRCVQSVRRIAVRSCARDVAISLRCILVAGLLTTAAGTAPGAAGELDSTFAGSGFSRTGFGGAVDAGNAVAAQADGKIVVVGAAGEHFGVVRYNAAGTLDSSFGNGGTVITNFGVYKSVATAVRVQPNDGKIVVAGYVIGVVGLTEGPMAVARYNPDGSLDTTFDGDGRVTTAIGSAQDRAFAVAIRSDGRIMIAGDTMGAGEDLDAAMVRYNPDGSRDASFGADGKVVTPLSPEHDAIEALAVYGDQVFAAGYVENGFSRSFAVMRYNANGSFDTNFNTTGKAFPVMGTDARAYAIAIQQGNGTQLQPDTVVVAGSATNSAGRDFAVARFHLNGTLDNTFDGDGKVTTPIAADNVGRAVVVQGQGALSNPRKIVVAGHSQEGSALRFSAVRYNANGALDTTFDGDGKILLPVGSQSDSARGLTLSAAGKYVLAGSSDKDFGVLRLNADGSPDTSFGTDARRIDDVGDQRAAGEGVALQPDGKIVAVGSNRGAAIALLRFNPDGSPDSAFDGDGKALHPIGFSVSGNALALQEDGKIIAAGGAIFTTPTIVGQMAVIRCHPDGSLDQSFDSDGIVLQTIGTFASAQAVLVQPDGKIVVAGHNGDGQSNMFVVRLLPNGMPDPEFDQDGVVITNVGAASEARALALQPDGRIIVAGFAADDFLLVRYLPNGALDSSFDGDGVAFVQFGAGRDRCHAMALQPDGRIVVGGNTFVAGENKTRFAVARLQSNGAPDLSFAGGFGKVVGPAFGEHGDSANAIVLQPDGRIVIAGKSTRGDRSVDDFAVVRLNSDGTLDTSVGNDGKLVFDLSAGNHDVANGAVLDAAGRVVLAGTAGNLIAVARLTADPPPPPTPTPSPTAVPAARLANISTRLRVETGDNVLIGGFIVTGAEQKRIIVRALGPSLPPGVGPLANPVLELYDGSGTLLASNDNWQDAPNRQEIIDSGIAPPNDFESAILQNVELGPHTAILSGAGGGTGVGLVEVYDLGSAQDSKLANISTRGHVRTGDNVMIGGLIITGSSAQKVIVRAKGPSLPVNGRLEDPTLELFDGSGAPVASNNNWRDTQEAEINATGIPPDDDREAATVQTLAPGAYTAVIRGATDTTGVALVEVYALN